MKVKELVSKLRQAYDVEIRENNFFLCKTTTQNKTIELFSEREVIDWFPQPKGLADLAVSLVINISSEEELDDTGRD